MKVYIVCPYGKTGGPRSLHQLGNKLVDEGLDVYMYYGYRGKKERATKPLYSDSKMKLAYTIEDKKENIVIVPESDTSWLLKLYNIKKVIWWLSLDFYLGNNAWYFAKSMTKNLGEPSVYVLLKFLKISVNNLRQNLDKKYLKPKNLNTVYHLYNSEYVRQYLKANNVKENRMQYLCGPIDWHSNNKIDILDNKKNIIAYNPAKMNRKIFKKVQNYIKRIKPSYKLVPIKNMTHYQVLNILKVAKVYLDLGYFPGPERMPREAVMQYCNIVTSNIGSAQNDMDVPIPRQCKFSLNSSNVKNIGNQVINMCENYNDYIVQFDRYRKLVKYQINIFDKNISNFSKKIKTRNIY